MTAIFPGTEDVENPSYPAPKFRMDLSITDFYHFTPESFHLEGYQWAPFDEKIPCRHIGGAHGRHRSRI